LLLSNAYQSLFKFCKSKFSLKFKLDPQSSSGSPCTLHLQVMNHLNFRCIDDFWCDFIVVHEFHYDFDFCKWSSLMLKYYPWILNECNVVLYYRWCKLLMILNLVDTWGQKKIPYMIAWNNLNKIYFKIHQILIIIIIIGSQFAWMSQKWYDKVLLFSSILKC